MLYLSPIWSSCNKELLEKVLRMQKRAARILLDAERTTHTLSKIILLFDFMFIEGHRFISFIITLINNRRLFNYDNRRDRNALITLRVFITNNTLVLQNIIPCSVGTNVARRGTSAVIRPESLPLAVYRSIG